MRMFSSRVVLLAATLAAVVVLSPAGGQAGLLDCLWGGGAGGQAQTTYTPRFAAPVVYYPTSSTVAVGPFARLRAALRPASTPGGSTTAVATTCYYVPQVCYRQVVQPTAVTSYLPVTARDACTGCPVTAYRPVVTWSNQVRLVPYTTYRVVCTQAQYVPAACAQSSYASFQQPGLYVVPAAPTGGGCTTCLPSTTSYMPVISVSPAGAASSIPAAYSSTATLPAAGSAPAGSTLGAGSSIGGPAAGGGPASGLPGSSPTASVPGGGLPPGAVPGSGLPPGAVSGSGLPPGAVSGTSTLPGGAFSGSPAGSVPASSAPAGNGSGGAPTGGGAGWPSSPSRLPLPSQFRQSPARAAEELRRQSSPWQNIQPQPAPAGPALGDPGDKTALAPPSLARSAEPIRGRLVPVEKLQIPEDNSHLGSSRRASGVWSVVRN